MDIANTSAQYIKGVGPDRLSLLKRVGISSIKDTLLHFPRRYEDRSNLKSISELIPDLFQTFKGKVASSKVFRTRRGTTIFQLEVSDHSSKIYCLWFNQPYMKKYFNIGDTILCYGKFQKTTKRQVIHPEYEIIRDESEKEETIHTGRIVPIYPLASGVNQRRLRRIINSAIKQYSNYMDDPLPTNIRARHKLLDMKAAIENVHFPVNLEQRDRARRRLVFDEFFILQLALALRKRKIKASPQGKSYAVDQSAVDDFLKELNFTPTKAQDKVMSEIREDMASEKPMHRLLQGEVGSGKTIVSAYALLIAACSGHQGAIMVPTEILARQHYVTLSNIFLNLGFSVTLLVNGMRASEKEEALDLISKGQTDIVIGTHTLIQKAIEFKDLGVVIIDEQHKFGVGQRATLKSKTKNPDTLVMTATPIPRTMAMTLYGDMDISVIDELPQGKRDVNTIWVDSSKLDDVYDFIKRQLTAGRQAYIIYPVIEESKALKSVGAAKMYETLKEKVFNDFTVGLIHGKMDDESKLKVMSDFKKKKIDLLVATTIVEVGIDIPNATVMVIENAERFGLSQLHQLRGRIGRSKHKSYCVLVSDADTDEATQRLEVISSSRNGFEIAEEDLSIRGPGELFGKAQHGAPQLNLGNVVSDVDILEVARKEAFELIDEDPDLVEDRHKALKDIMIKNFKEKFHLSLVG